MADRGEVRWVLWWGSGFVPLGPEIGIGVGVEAPPESFGGVGVACGDPGVGFQACVGVPGGEFGFVLFVDADEAGCDVEFFVQEVGAE